MSNPFQSMTNASTTLNGGAAHASSLSACVDFSSDWSDAAGMPRQFTPHLSPRLMRIQKLLYELGLAMFERAQVSVVLFESVCGPCP